MIPDKVLIIAFIVIQIFVLIESTKSVSHKLDYLINEIFINKELKLKEIEKQQKDSLSTTNNENLIEDEREKSKTFLDYYHDGVAAYLSNDWESCINHMERSLIMYHEYYEGISVCRIRCENERLKYIPKYPENYDDRHFYEKLIYKTLCIERCKMTILQNLPKYFMFLRDEREIYEQRKPYEYLQICYFRDGEPEKAISAAYTFVVANPDHEVMKKNIQYYANLKQLDKEKIELQDFEDKRFSGFYRDAMKKYIAEEWEHAIELFEISIDVWCQEFDKCRAFCEGEFNQGWLPEFATAVSNHYIFSLRCKQNCSYELSYINGQYRQSLLPKMYDYLQYSYYKNNNIKEACQSAASYLLFYPDAEEMLANVKFYKSLPNIIDEYFEPRPEAKAVYYKNFYEKDLIDTTDKEFFQLLMDLNESNDQEFIQNNEIPKEPLIDDKINNEGESLNEKLEKISSRYSLRKTFTEMIG